jgi:hypothetical protein
MCLRYLFLLFLFIGCSPQKDKPNLVINNIRLEYYNDKSPELVGELENTGNAIAYNVIIYADVYWNDAHIGTGSREMHNMRPGDSKKFNIVFNNVGRNQEITEYKTKVIYD